MKLKFIVFTFLYCVSIWGSGYPTVWTIYNFSSEDAVLNCEGNAQGLSNKIRFSKKVQKQTPCIIEWKNFYNDGMGLNYTSWKCRMDDKETSFKTDWGENTILKITDDSISKE